METPVENSALTENVELQSVITSDVVDQNHDNTVSSPPNNRYIFLSFSVRVFEYIRKCNVTVLLLSMYMCNYLMVESFVITYRPFKLLS